MSTYFRQNGHKDFSRRTEKYAQGVIDARLGRPARDVLEATIVLEAWTGRPARQALSSAPALVDPELPAPIARGAIEPSGDRDQQSVVAEGLTLILSILSIAAWASPLSRDFGAHSLSEAIRASLPIAVGLQWALRSRYLSRRDGLAALLYDGPVCLLLLGLLVEVPLALQPHWGPIAALIVPIWVGGTIVTRRGWGLLYAGTLVGATIALEEHAPAYLVLGLLAGFTLLTSLAAMLTRRQRGDDRPGSISKALLAGLLGACVGLLLVGDPSLGWGVHGIHPAVALLPSVIGSLWGGYYLWNLFDEVPRQLLGVTFSEASRARLGAPATRMMFGAIARLVGATVVLSGIVIALGGLTRGTDDPSVFIAFGCVALASLLIGLMESLALRRAAFLAAIAALSAEFAWHYLVHWRIAGAALVVGAAVGVIVTLPPLTVRLWRSGAVLATTLWIQ